MTHSPPKYEIAAARQFCTHVLDKPFKSDKSRLDVIAAIDPSPMGVLNLPDKDSVRLHELKTNRDVLRFVRKSLERVRDQQEEFRREILESAAKDIEFGDNRRGKLAKAETVEFEDRKLKETQDAARLYAAVNTLCNTLEEWDNANLFFESSVENPKVTLPERLSGAVKEAYTLCIAQKEAYNHKHNAALVDAIGRVVGHNMRKYEQLTSPPKTARDFGKQAELVRRVEKKLQQYESPQSWFREYDQKIVAYYAAVAGVLQSIAYDIEQLTKAQQGGMTR